MKKRSYIRTTICFRDVYNNSYCERFICRSFLSLQQILDLSDGMLESLPDNKIIWSTFKLKMRFVTILEYSEI